MAIGHVSFRVAPVRVDSLYLRRMIRLVLLTCAVVALGATIGSFVSRQETRPMSTNTTAAEVRALVGTGANRSTVRAWPPLPTSIIVRPQLSGGPIGVVAPLGVIVPGTR